MGSFHRRRPSACSLAAARPPPCEPQRTTTAPPDGRLSFHPNFLSLSSSSLFLLLPAVPPSFVESVAPVDPRKHQISTPSAFDSSPFPHGPPTALDSSSLVSPCASSAPSQTPSRSTLPRRTSSAREPRRPPDSDSLASPIRADLHLQLCCRNRYHVDLPVVQPPRRRPGHAGHDWALILGHLERTGSSAT